AGERFDMIYNSLVAELKDVTRVIIIPANDIKDNSLWVAHLTRLVPKFDVVFTNSPLVGYLFKQAGIEVRNTPIYEREEYSANHIRELIVADKQSWKKLVPKAVVEVIKEIEGVNRLKTIYSTDKS
ncbi:MAG: nicotinamide-nucleotide adenylyltransferase, partial [Asgard group archaeon]|nr:nicotinamide-nucleotide adenylyltransferase [Asgard group archaeon]